MLRRVSPKDLELGMYVHRLEGSWLDHPFWRSRFLISSPDTLDLLRRSPVQAVVIDESRSKRPPGRRKPAAAPRPAVRVTSRSGTGGGERTSLVREYERAARLVNKSKRLVANMFGEARLGKAVNSQEVFALVDELAASVARRPDAFVSIARLKTKHEYTYMHSVAVCGLMINFARHLGLSDSEVREAGFAGLLHDIGKAAMPRAILDKPGPLDPAEFQTMKTHPERGFVLLSESSDVPEAARDVCLHHHERVDGTGYPYGLEGRRLSQFARMGAICDVYDAITSDRAYKRAWNPGEAIQRMRSWHGHFDAGLLEAFVGSIGIYPVGALVRLQSGGLAVVTSINPEDPTRPPILPLRSLGAGRWAAADHSQPCDEDILGIEHPEEVKVTNFEALRAVALRIAAIG